MVIDARHRDTPFLNHRPQGSEPTDIGNVEHDDHVRPAEFPDSVGGLVGVGEAVENELQARGRRRRVGDYRVDTACPKEVQQSDFTAEPVAVGTDVGRQADPLARLEDRGQLVGGSAFCVG
ncbi:MAG: hypothetical protein IIA27_03830 [Gemmatimonadetes bacterium]|nr:hypothetical protein [Gemmatimonadota bacterium]